MITKYDVLIPGQPTETREVDWPAQPSFDQIKAVVQPIIGENANMEHVWILSKGGERSCMFVDEDGKLKQLPRNALATAEYRRNMLTKLPGTDAESFPFIVGPAVVFHRRVWF